MTLTAPEHLRRKMTRAPLALKQERDEWMREQHQLGRSGTEMAAALGIRPEAVHSHLRALGCGRTIIHSVGNLRVSGISSGNVKKAVGAMPPCARGSLADAAARHGKPMADVLADFWAQHHGAQA